MNSRKGEIFSDFVGRVAMDERANEMGGVGMIMQQTPR